MEKNPLIPMAAPHCKPFTLVAQSSWNLSADLIRKGLDVSGLDRAAPALRTDFDPTGYCHRQSGAR